MRERVIELLSEFEGKYIPQSYIHRSLKVSKSRVSEVLRELEKEGLIQRVSVGRVNIVHIMPGAFRGAIERAKARELKLGIVYSSEYLFLGFFVKGLLRNNISVDVKVFKDSFEATRQLAEGLVDMAFSPFVGQLYLYPAYRTYKVVGGGVKGGFRVLHKPGSETIYSSMISTMDYARYLALKMGIIEASNTHYYKNPSQLMHAAKRGGYVVTWHPVYLELSKLGYSTILTHKDLGIEFCCTLATLNTVTEDLLDTIRRSLVVALEEYKRKPDEMLEYYSSITGIATSTLKTAISEYHVVNGVHKKHVENVVASFAPVLPDRNIYRELLYDKY
ncbi:MAG: transcriptional regulator [Desulfurococcaceae archaeon]